MPKGMFTQGVCVLFEEAPSLDELEMALLAFEVQGRREEKLQWPLSGPGLMVAYHPEDNGAVTVDIVDRPWPDHMGDPKTETALFGAWSMGNFGPFAFPGGLDRATQQCWGWEAGPEVVARHKAFVRVRSSYVFGADEDDPVVPEDYAPQPELEFVTKLAAALLSVPGALCYFNPNGEVLRDDDGLRESLNFGWAHDLPPLELWANVRLFAVDAEWSMMDTVGNSQLDVPDMEACFKTGTYDFNDVDNFLRNVTMYLLSQGDIIDDGDTMDGPGEIHWQAHICESGLCDPPRQTLRWLPTDSHQPPAEVLDKGELDDDEDEDADDMNR